MAQNVLLLIVDDADADDDDESCVCSCFASHLVVQHHYQQQLQQLSRVRCANMKERKLAESAGCVLWWDTEMMRRVDNIFHPLRSFHPVSCSIS